MRTLLLSVALSGIVFVGPARAQEIAKISEPGLSFEYPKDWKAKSDKNPELRVKVANDKGAHAIVQLYAAGTDPKLINDLLDKGLRKAFEGKLVKGSDKAVKRKIAGAERVGFALEFEVAKGVTIHIEIYTFTMGAKKQLVNVNFQHAAFDADAAKKAFDLIAGSLTE